jgi:hypothetical protein
MVTRASKPTAQLAVRHFRARTLAFLRPVRAQAFDDES